LNAFATSFHDVFLIGIPLAALAFVVSLFLKESPLKTASKEEAKGEALEIA